VFSERARLYFLAEGKWVSLPAESQRNATRTFRCNVVLERTKNIVLLLKKVRQDLLLGQYRRERKGDLLVDYIKYLPMFPEARDEAYEGSGTSRTTALERGAPARVDPSVAKTLLPHDVPTLVQSPRTK
jgi:hypothetical protein